MFSNTALCIAAGGVPYELTCRQPITGEAERDDSLLGGKARSGDGYSSGVDNVWAVPGARSVRDY